jgi:putative PIN family toxin of toxin-antitoxin system
VDKALSEEVFLSADIQKELLSLNRKLSKRLTLAQYLEWNTSFLPLLSKMALVPVRYHIVLCRDPKDDAYLSLAKSVPADFLITGDADLLSLPREKLDSSGLTRLRIITPKDFLRV